MRPTKTGWCAICQGKGEHDAWRYSPRRSRRLRDVPWHWGCRLHPVQWQGGGRSTRSASSCGGGLLTLWHGGRSADDGGAKRVRPLTPRLPAGGLSRKPLMDKGLFGLTIAVLWQGSVEQREEASHDRGDEGAGSTEADRCGSGSYSSAGARAVLRRWIGSARC